MSRFLLGFFAVGCTAPDTSALFNAVDVEITDHEGGEARFAEAIRSASESLHVALPDAEDPQVLDAIGEAWDNGLEVELIVDFDDQGDAALQPLFDIGVPVTFASDGLSYFEFALNQTVSWDSFETVMSHAYVVVDRQRILTATTAGHVRTGDRVLTELRGEELLEDWLIEHNQIFGGIDGTAVTAFDSPAKSIADFRWRYGTGTSSDLEVWFGPQERLSKRVIDAIYSSREAVWVMTDDLANEGIFSALADKQRWGFDVRVITGPSLGDTSSALLRAYDTEVADAERRELQGVGEVPTVVIIDPGTSPGGFSPLTTVMVISHDLYSSARLYRGVEVVTDQLIDGVMVVLSNRTDDDRDDIEPFVSLFEDRFETGVPR